MSSVLLVLQLIVAIFLVAVILMQRSNGGALSGLGGGDIGGLLSARSKGNILTRITAVLATLFFVLSLAISIYFSRMEVKQVSVVDNVVATQAQEPVTENVPAESETSEQATPSVPATAEAPAEKAPSVPATAEAPAETAPSVPAEPEVPVAE